MGGVAAAVQLGATALCESEVLWLLSEDAPWLARLMLRLSCAWLPRCLSTMCKVGCSLNPLSA